MAHEFDKDYWESHWQGGRTGGPGSMAGNPPNPYLASELGDLTPGRALDAGCGSGTEAHWLASHGWQVTAADISTEALAHAAEQSADRELSHPIVWVQADLTRWVPAERFDLVTTHYAHPTMPQLDFYARIADWVAPGGTLLIVGHLHEHGATGHGGHDHHPPAEASATAAGITSRLQPSTWEIVTATEQHRQLGGPGEHAKTLHDVVVRARRTA